ncbi:MAG: hypothetical protein WAV19_06710, partial [Blautia wexlerae]
GEDIGFTEEPMPEEETEQKTEQKTENSAKQFLMIIITLPAVCILVAAIIFAIREKRRSGTEEKQKKHPKTEGGVSNEEELEIFITTYSNCICIDYGHILSVLPI